MNNNQVEKKIYELLDGVLTVSMVALVLQRKEEMSVIENLSDSIRNAVALSEGRIEIAKDKLIKIFMKYLREEAEEVVRELETLENEDLH